MGSLGAETPGYALWSALAARVREVRAIVASSSDADLARICSAEGWPVVLVACHVALGLRRQGNWVARAIAGRAPVVFDWERTHQLNALVARDEVRPDRAEVIAALDRGVTRWRDLIGGVGDEVLRRPAFRYETHERTVGWVAGKLAMRHVEEHLRSIRGALGT